MKDPRKEENGSPCVGCRAGHRSSKKWSVNRQCRYLAYFIKRSIDNVESRTSFWAINRHWIKTLLFEVIIRHLLSKPSFLNRSFVIVVQSYNFDKKLIPFLLRLGVTDQNNFCTKRYMIKSKLLDLKSQIKLQFSISYNCRDAYLQWKKTTCMT